MKKFILKLCLTYILISSALVLALDPYQPCSFAVGLDMGKCHIIIYNYFILPCYASILIALTITVATYRKYNNQQYFIYISVVCFIDGLNQRNQ